MKLDTLRRYFENNKRTKLHLVTADYAVTGFAGRPRADEGDALLVDLAPFVVFFLRGADLVEGREPFGPVRIDATVQVTRRLRTHRRHVEHLGLPEAYLAAASDLL